MTDPLVSVAVCTWNRSLLLRQTLDHLVTMRVPNELAWELLIVNNSSTDDTDSVIASYESRLPLRRLFAATAGLSHARNVAVREAKGRYLVWTDDDVLVDTEWLAAYAAAFERWPNAAAFGGAVVPHFEGNPPKWLAAVLPRVANAFAGRDLGPVPVPLNAREGRLPFGANFAVRTAEQRRYLYNPELGRDQLGRTRVGEETEVVTSILDAGHDGWWVPEARVRHWIPAARQSTKYLREYFYSLGQNDARRPLSPQIARLFGRPRHLWRYVVEAEVRYRARRFFTSPDVWIEDLIAASRGWGQLRRRAADASTTSEGAC